MRRPMAALVMAALLAFLPGPALAEMPAPPMPESLVVGQRLIDDWQVKAAEELAEELVRHYPDSGDAQFLKARVEFFKGNYGYATKLLERIDDKSPRVKDMKALTEATRRATEPFISRETDHFIFRFVDGPDRVLLPFAEEVMERSYQRLGELFGHLPKEKVLIEFYPGRESLAHISPLTIQDIATSGTVALCKYNRIMMITPASLVRGYNWMDTLSHEYIHFLLTTKSRNSVPLWLHEGIAKHFETYWREGDGALEPVMESILAGGLKSDYLIPLESMMPSFAKLKTAEDVQLAYAQVATMVGHMLDEKGPGVFAQLLDDLAAGGEFEATLEKHLGMGLPAFQEAWRTAMGKKNLKVIPGIQALAPRFKDSGEEEKPQKEYTEVGSKRSQDLTFLGDILKSRNLLRAAILEYRRAHEETGTRSPVLFNKLGGTYLLVKEYDQAETVLKTTLGDYPSFHTTLTNLGELYYETERYDSARTYFERAVRVNPFNPFVHQRLILIYSKLGLKREMRYQNELYSFIQ